MSEGPVSERNQSNLTAPVDSIRVLTVTFLGLLHQTQDWLDMNLAADIGVED